MEGVFQDLALPGHIVDAGGVGDAQQRVSSEFGRQSACAVGQIGEYRDGRDGRRRRADGEAG